MNFSTGRHAIHETETLLTALELLTILSNTGICFLPTSGFQRIDSAFCALSTCCEENAIGTLKVLFSAQNKLKSHNASIPTQQGISYRFNVYVVAFCSALEFLWSCSSGAVVESGIFCQLYLIITSFICVYRNWLQQIVRNAVIELFHSTFKYVDLLHRRKSNYFRAMTSTRVLN